ncbi:MAG: hypothetical protein AAF492_22670 [Verrucomicrobiota bacterium]
MRDKYRFKRAKNNLVTFIWKVVLAIGLIYVLMIIFDQTGNWRSLIHDTIK